MHSMFLVVTSVAPPMRSFYRSGRLLDYGRCIDGFVVMAVMVIFGRCLDFGRWVDFVVLVAVMLIFGHCLLLFGSFDYFVQ